MDIKTMSAEELEARSAAIVEELDQDGADVSALGTEMRAIHSELDSRKAAEAAKAEIRAQVAAGAGETIAEVKTEERTNKTMDNMEIRARVEDALAETIKGRATPEQRALLTTDAQGTVEVAKIVDEFVWTDWDKSPILSRIQKRYIEGNYAVNYEASASGATKHTEGAEAPQEESLVLGTVNFIAQYYKKWIKVSDRVLALRGARFLQYLRDEFGHQLAMALENAVVAEIAASPLAANVTHAIDGDAVLFGFAALSDEASDPVAIMSKQTYATIKAMKTDAGARIEDPFNGLEVLFNSTVTGVLVGDLSGVVANFPEGEEFKYIVDEASLAESDLVKIVGKVLADVHLVRPNGFAVVEAE